MKMRILIIFLLFLVFTNITNAQDSSSSQRNGIAVLSITVSYSRPTCFVYYDYNQKEDLIIKLNLDFTSSMTKEKTIQSLMKAINYIESQGYHLVTSNLFFVGNYEGQYIFKK